MRSTVILKFGSLLKRNDALLKHGIIMLVASVSGGALNYLYQLLMGRMLGPEQYGILGALISLTYVLTVPVQTIQVSTMKSITNLQAAGRAEDLGFLIRHRVKQISLWSVLAMVAILAGSGLIARFLQIPSAIPVMMLGAALFFQLLGPTFSGSLQGLQRFLRLASSSVANFAGKLAFAVALVLLGLGVEGALAGMVLGPALGMLLAAYFLRDVLMRPAANRAVPRESGYSAYAFVTFLSITLFYNVDVILVKRLFDPVQAGYYMAASTLAKAVFFGSGAIAGAMFPKVSARHEGGNGAQVSRLLRDALLDTGALAGLGALVLNLFPKTLIPALYGTAYQESTALVGLFSVGMMFFSLSYVIALYQLAIDQRRFLLVLGVGAVAEVIGILLFHTTLRQVVFVFTMVMVTVFLALGSIVVRQKHGYAGIG
jgi:O-antigen/teichoic acid export membrane protein